MLFQKKDDKNEDGKAAPDMAPRQPRYDCIAFVRVNGFEGQAALRNISISGFRMESRTFVAMQPGEEYVMQISPPDETGIRLFDVTVEVRWIKSDVTSFNVGLFVKGSSVNRNLEKYIDYLKKQG